MAYEELRWELQQNPDERFGFIVYRCTYESDEEWHRFMAYFDTTVRGSLGRAQLDDICDRIDWAVQEGEDLDGASIDAVRQKFQAWVLTDVNAEGWRYGGSRHHACVMVGQADLEDVLKFAASTEEQRKELIDPCVWLVSARDGGEDDDGCEPCTRIDIRSLMPRAYDLLEGPGWLSIYDSTRP